MAGIGVMEPASVICGACGSSADRPAGQIEFYLPGRNIETAIWRCSHCGTYTRQLDFDDPAIARHFEIASYTDPDAEPRLRHIRSSFFEYLADLLADRIARPLNDLRILDFGASYAHFLELLAKRGAQAEGVELVPQLRKTARQRGLTVHAELPTVGDSTFDAIVAIDSLYYLNDPLAVLRRMCSLLKNDGLLMIRVPNRTWLLDLCLNTGLVIHKDRFGDAKFNFSIEGLALLLDRAGFQPREFIWREKGKADPRRHIRWYYLIAGVMSEYLSLRVSPGMILLAVPKPEAPSQPTD